MIACCARHCPKHFTCIDSLNPHNKLLRSVHNYCYTSYSEVQRECKNIYHLLNAHVSQMFYIHFMYICFHPHLDSTRLGIILHLKK